MSRYATSLTIHANSAYEQSLLFAAVADASRIASQFPEAWEMTIDVDFTPLTPLIEDVVCKIYGNAKALDLAKQIISAMLDASMDEAGVRWVVNVLNDISVAAGALADSLEGKGLRES